MLPIRNFLIERKPPLAAKYKQLILFGPGVMLSTVVYIIKLAQLIMSSPHRILTFFGLVIKRGVKKWYNCLPLYHKLCHFSVFHLKFPLNPPIFSPKKRWNCKGEAQFYRIERKTISLLYLSSLNRHKCHHSTQVNECCLPKNLY